MSEHGITEIVDKLLREGRAYLDYDRCKAAPSDIAAAVGAQECPGNEFGRGFWKFRTSSGAILSIQSVGDCNDYFLDLDQPPGRTLHLEGVADSGSRYFLDLIFDKDAKQGDMPAVVKGWFGPDSERQHELVLEGMNPDIFEFSLRIERGVGYKQQRYSSMVNGRGSGGTDPQSLLPRALRDCINLALPGGAS